MNPQAPVVFTSDFQELNQYIAENNPSQIYFLVDENTHTHCLPILLAEIATSISAEIIEIPAGEESKSLEIVYQVWSSLTELGADRKSLVVNCGGGVVGDFGGFVAATFKRGIPFVNVPTSLLAMVDASVGGKNGIDLNGIKNQIGTFTQPEMVLVNPAFLSTLPFEELRSGFAEMLKHALIKDAVAWKNLCTLEDLSVAKIEKFIAPSVEIKKEVVEIDPTEKGLRKILNAGHTLGHAVETYFLNQQTPMLHGEAVAIGLLLEAHIAWQKEVLSKNERDEIAYHLTQFFEVVKLPLAKDLWPILLHDKKNQQNTVQCIILEKIGKAMETTVEINLAEVEAALEYYATFG